MIGIYVGENSIRYSAQWIRFEDLSYINLSIKYLRIGFYILLVTFFLLQFFFKEYRLKKSADNGFKKLFVADISWIIIILLSIPLYIVFIDIYIPVFQDKTFISKYFQDRLEDFIPYRPFYTLSINAFSTILFLQINYFLSSYKRISFFKLLINKKFLKLGFIFITLFFTAKRGQIYYPIFISLIAYLIYKRHLLKLVFLGSTSVIVIGLSRNFSEIFRGELSLEHTLMTLSTSFFVSVRELTRVLFFFNNNDYGFLYGKTYIAGFFSFIPTKINALKANYNYMRYTSIISNQNPDEFGGMRSTYIGEAYINFGLVGIVLLPILFGILVYLIHLFIKKYSGDNFIYYIMVFWMFKILVLPFYENGSSMFLFFFITVIFMFICALTIRTKNKRAVLKITFLRKNDRK
ncbi:MAG: O-antigen polysaccharide polymerase Wzy [Flavobacteriaceae bacterium]|nr:MAG: O-antigen polysaccharide polymerase Wzy [Flavobacteriaceae bacterium]